jgi:ERCC4-related helicase
MVQRRLYQEVIFAAASRQNTLVVLPTGMGKTVIAIVLAAHRLEKAPASKVVVLAPTKPLVAQHYRRFGQMLRVVPDKLRMITGETPSANRADSWRLGSILFMTPQTLHHELNQARFDSSEISLLVFDEVHRATGRYDYVAVADYYVRQCPEGRILALTASPGNARELCDALHIDNIEARTERSSDVAPYRQLIDLEYVVVDLPPDFRRVDELQCTAIQKAAIPLIEMGLLRLERLDYLGQRDLLELRAQVARMMKSAERRIDPQLYDAMLSIGVCLRLSHAREILETQGISQLLRYYAMLEGQARGLKAPRSVRLLVSASWYQEGKTMLEILAARGENHPKHPVLVCTLRQQLDVQPGSHILVFARFRATASILTNLLAQQQGIRPARFVGQTNQPGDPGLSQKEQLALLRAFEQGTHNVLVATNIGEEGLDISECNLVVFYDSVPSAIRRIQRAGRTGRRSPGRLVALMTRGTGDESYYRAGLRRQERMQATLFRQVRRLRQGRSTR